MVLKDHNQPVSHVPGNGDTVFSSYVRFIGQGYLELQVPAPVGPNKAYGLDVSIRRLSCDEKSLCFIASAGDLTLMMDAEQDKLGCAFIRTDHTLGATFVPAKLDALNTVGCATDGKNLQIFVNGEGKWNRNTAVMHGYTHVFLGIGNRSSKLSGKLTGEVGRYRYWRDISAMQATLQVPP